MKTSSLQRNFSWALVGSFLYSACQWGILVLLAKALPMSDVGIFALGAAATAPVFLLCNVRLRNLLAAGVTSDGGFGDYVLARAVTSVVAVGLSIAIALLLADQLMARMIIVLIALTKAVDSMSDICHGQFQLTRRLQNSAIGLTINGVVSVVLVAVTLWFTGSLALATGAYLCGSFIAFASWDWPRALRSVEPQRTGRVVSRTARFRDASTLVQRAAPLGLSAALGSVQANTPKYFVGVYLGAADLAVYSALAYIPMLGGVVVSAIGQAALPELANDFAPAPHRYWRRLVKLSLAGCALGVVSVVLCRIFGEAFLRVSYTQEYAAHSGLLLWLVGAAAVTYAFVFMGTAATARLRLKAQMHISLLSTLVLVGSTGPLLGAYGLVGAAYAALLAATAEALAYLVLTLRDMASARTLKAASTVATV